MLAYILRSFNPSPYRGGNQVGPCEKWYHGVVNPVKAGDRLKVCFFFLVLKRFKTSLTNEKRVLPLDQDTRSNREIFTCHSLIFLPNNFLSK